ncbi:unnamed protein product [Didymodactylos carnosus]|uniref:Uncharacterized protein n=1 Tax=Didymodactylos carnosus TaxID=1234261 RepID=A0A815K8S2_9BILA|nr:unnamed protein product [Didymodactylos carnosus]CAF4286850.1 unnamed protein product [Didymodactylos carnosus]
MKFKGARNMTKYELFAVGTSNNNTRDSGQVEHGYPASDNIDSEQVSFEETASVVSNKDDKKIFMARVLPSKEFRLWLITWKFSLNPGQFTIKEHALIFIMAQVSSLTTPAALKIQQGLWNINPPGFGLALFFVILAQLIGYNIARTAVARGTLARQTDARGTLVRQTDARETFARWTLARSVRTQMSQEAKTSNKVTHDIVADGVSHLSDQAVASLPDLRNLKKTIRRIRQKLKILIHYQRHAIQWSSRLT